jgi:2-C-methyl-D-erythritol 4-phosphate cytidylyltransferase/2-C-methyl-D-erythritol 2,4-cyclodiphosphate synthase
LAIAERMARLLDHPLRLESKAGGPTLFGVVVPRVAPEQAPGDADAFEAAPSRGRVVVVDNDASMRESLSALLASWGYDVAVARAAGMTVRIVDGDESNLKITTAADFARAERILAPMDLRIGTGYDVHRFGPGAAVTLCGVRVPHDRGLQGHSDADVGLHALTDAIYGALAEGDIGRHFPPSEPRWKDVESHVFLTHAVRLADEKGFRINNMDITLVCERPKIGAHAPAMAERLSAITGVPAGRVSVKATTSERLGFTGRGEGIAAQAAVTLVPACG